MNEGGLSLEPSENSSKRWRDCLRTNQRLISLSDKTEVVRHFTLNPCGAGDISYNFIMKKYKPFIANVIILFVLLVIMILIASR